MRVAALLAIMSIKHSPGSTLPTCRQIILFSTDRNAPGVGGPGTPNRAIRHGALLRQAFHDCGSEWLGSSCCKDASSASAMVWRALQSCGSAVA